MHYGPRVDSASNRNKYLEHFLGGKGDQYTRLTTIPLSCADYLEIWDFNLNLLEPSGPVISLYWGSFICLYASLSTSHGEVEVRHHTFLTFFLDGNEWLAAHPGCFVPGYDPLITNGQEAGWASELAQTWCGRQNSLDAARN